MPRAELILAFLTPVDLLDLLDLGVALLDVGVALLDLLDLGLGVTLNLMLGI